MMVILMVFSNDRTIHYLKFLFNFYYYVLNFFFICFTRDAPWPNCDTQNQEVVFIIFLSLGKWEREREMHHDQIVRLKEALFII